MAISDYVVLHDQFVADEPEAGMAFPCCACVHRHHHTEGPCRACGHNLSSELVAVTVPVVDETALRRVLLSESEAERTAHAAGVSR